MSTIRLKLVGLALVTALGASAAHAQRAYSAPAENKVAAAVKAAKAGQTGHGRVDIRQHGRDNAAAAGQAGPANSIGVYQDGVANIGQVSQMGANNTGNIIQLGKGNTGAITQTGDNNNACLVQIGNNHAAGITQTGGQSVGIAQNKARTWEFSAELCEIYRDQDPYFLHRAIRGPRAGQG